VDEVTQRLQRDLRTRFPTIVVTVGVDEDGDSVCEVAEDRTPWGSVGWDKEDEPSTQAEAEAALVRLAEEVADNLWPDDLTDPWPLCPLHRDHALAVCLTRGVASWTCRVDADTSVKIGCLGDT
jgi:hypothetical protein